MSNDPGRERKSENSLESLFAPPEQGHGDDTAKRDIPEPTPTPAEEPPPPDLPNIDSFLNPPSETQTYPSLFGDISPAKALFLGANLTLPGMIRLGTMSKPVHNQGIEPAPSSFGIPSPTSKSSTEESASPAKSESRLVDDSKSTAASSIPVSIPISDPVAINLITAEQSSRGFMPIGSFSSAMTKRDLQTLTDLLDQYPDTDLDSISMTMTVVDKNGRFVPEIVTPLLWAVNVDAPKIVALFLSRGASPRIRSNIAGFNAFTLAAERSAAMVGEFLTHPELDELDAYGRSMLLLLVTQYEDKFKQVLKGHPDFDLNRLNKQGETLVGEIARLGTSEQLRKLLMHGGLDPNKGNIPPLLAIINRGKGDKDYYSNQTKDYVTSMGLLIGGETLTPGAIKANLRIHDANGRSLQRILYEDCGVKHPYSIFLAPLIFSEAVKDNDPALAQSLIAHGLIWPDKRFAEGAEMAWGADHPVTKFLRWEKSENKSTGDRSIWDTLKGVGTVLVAAAGFAYLFSSKKKKKSKPVRRTEPVRKVDEVAKEEAPILPPAVTIDPVIQAAADAKLMEQNQAQIETQLQALIDRMKSEDFSPKIAGLPDSFAQRLNDINSELGKSLSKLMAIKDLTPATKKIQAQTKFLAALNAFGQEIDDFKARISYYEKLTEFQTKFKTQYPKVKAELKAASAVHERMPLKLEDKNHNKPKVKEIRTKGPLVAALRTKKDELKAIKKEITNLFETLMKDSVENLNERLSQIKKQFVHFDYSSQRPGWLVAGLEENEIDRELAKRDLGLDSEDELDAKESSSFVACFQLPSKSSQRSSTSFMVPFFAEPPSAAPAVPVLPAKGRPFGGRDNKGNPTKTAAAGSTNQPKEKKKDGKKEHKHQTALQATSKFFRPPAPLIPLKDIIALAKKIDTLLKKSKMKDNPMIKQLAEEGTMFFIAELCRPHFGGRFLHLEDLRHNLVHHRDLLDYENSETVHAAYQSFMELFKDGQSKTKFREALADQQHLLYRLTTTKREKRHYKPKYPLNYNQLLSDCVQYQTNTSTPKVINDFPARTIAELFFRSQPDFLEVVAQDPVTQQYYDDLNKEAKRYRHAQAKKSAEQPDEQPGERQARTFELLKEFIADCEFEFSKELRKGTVHKTTQGEKFVMLDDDDPEELAASASSERAAPNAQMFS